MSSDWAPTPKLRFVERAAEGDVPRTVRILQQWFAEDMPSYMRDSAKGEWRDVPLGVEAP